MTKFVSEFSLSAFAGVVVLVWSALEVQVFGSYTILARCYSRKFFAEMKIIERKVISQLIPDFEGKLKKNNVFTAPMEFFGKDLNLKRMRFWSLKIKPRDLVFNFNSKMSVD